MARELALNGLIEEQSVEVSTEGLLESRSGHQTVWQESSFEAEGAPEAAPEGVFDLVTYPSPAGELAAYLSPDPGDGKRHPAVVWSKGGFGGIGSFFWDDADPQDDQSARAFREAGIVMMCPSWRGENENPGRFELFFGEVDDLLAAIEYTKALPYVDPERVYLAGHSTGGTMTLLAAVSGAEFRAAFSFGGAPDLAAVMADGGYGNTPYDPDSEIDHQLRSAIRYTPFIKHPVFYFEGGPSSYHMTAAMMEETAHEHGVEFKAYELPGDHFNILAPITAMVAEKISQDHGDECNIEFSQSELEAAWKKMHDVPLAATFEKWMDQGGELSDMVNELGDGALADDIDDVKAMRQVVRQLAGKTEDQAAMHLASAVRPIRPSMDELVLKYFDNRIAPMLREWLHKQIAAKEAPSDVLVMAVLDVLETLLINIDDEAAHLVLESVDAGFGMDSWLWSGVFDAMEPDDGFFETVARVFKRRPPEGQCGERWLNRVNRLFLDDDWEGPNPFNSKEGKARLREMLAADSEFAYTAGYGLAFVDKETRRDLVAYGLKHPDMAVQMEVAWADGKSGGKAGIAFLREACINLEWSTLAINYLDELKQGAVVPAKAKEPGFAAKAKMLGWLKHPNELGEMPTSIELFDTRNLFWPPSDKSIPVWLFSFTYRFDDDKPMMTGYGMVGGMTWSSFGEFEKPPSAEELYTHHCQLEMQTHSDDGDDSEEFTIESALKLLKEKNPGMFDE